jgi:antitoxin (DNA-binding transcriptional repressor) of toxin-antitoxin stability system
MKRYTAAQARQNFAELLDAAEKGESVVIERRGTRFGLLAERRAPKARRPEPLVEILDPSVEAGQWTWDLGPRGLRFKPRKRSA